MRFRIHVTHYPHLYPVQLVNSNPTEKLYKAAKSSHNSDAKTNGSTAKVEDDLDDVEAGPEMPPDQEDDIPDDEDGRFFGGGVNKDTVKVLDYIDGQHDDDAAPEVFDEAWLRRLAVNFERRISKNAELRAKFGDNPQKFMSSEADLDDDIKSLSILSEHSHFYPEFVKLGCVASLVSLLSHENTDIAIDAIEIIDELTDEDVTAAQTDWDTLVDELLDADLLSLLHSNFSRLDESQESDRAGVYHILHILENLASRSSIASSIGKTTEFLSWLLKRIQNPPDTKHIDQNTSQASEILTIFLQASASNRTSLISLNAIDTFLQLLAPYRKRDPSPSSDEEEYISNIFHSLTCCTDEPSGKMAFLDAEGTELCVIMLREGKFSKEKAMTVLDHALGGSASSSSECRACCVRLIESAGLKPLFSVLTSAYTSSTSSKKPAKVSSVLHQDTAGHVLGILSSLLRLLPANEAPRIRLLAKFVEKDYQALDRLVRLRRDYGGRLAATDARIVAERRQIASADVDEEAEDMWLSQRLDSGLYILQAVDVVLAWVTAEDDGAKEKTKVLLADGDQNTGFEPIRATLRGMPSFFASTRSSVATFESASGESVADEPAMYRANRRHRYRVDFRSRQRDEKHAKHVAFSPRVRLASLLPRL